MKYSRNKQKDTKPFAGILSVKLLSTGIPMSVLALIYASLATTMGGAV